jgi:hypothetical protein
MFSYSSSPIGVPAPPFGNLSATSGTKGSPESLMFATMLGIPSAFMIDFFSHRQ